MAVYAIKNTRTGSVKIGYSLDPGERLTTLQTGNEDALELISTFLEGTAEFEGKLHDLLDGYEERIRGEWFQGPVTDCVAIIVGWMDTGLGIHALRYLLERLTTMCPEHRRELAALLTTTPPEVDQDWGDRVVHLLRNNLH